MLLPFWSLTTNATICSSISSLNEKATSLKTTMTAWAATTSLSRLSKLILQLRKSAAAAAAAAVAAVAAAAAVAVAVAAAAAAAAAALLWRACLI